jgi:7-cyano-7-deazaguanine reductase
MDDPSELTMLGQRVRGPADHVECFDAPPGCSLVRFTGDELTSLCPVTGQPDFSSVEIEYVPDASCVESKSLKLFLWSFRDRAVFAEKLAVEIATEIRRAAQPRSVKVVVRQNVRGGLALETTAELGPSAETADGDA